MDFVTPLLNTLQSQAKLDLTRAQTEDTYAAAELRASTAELGRAKAANDEYTRKVMMDVMQGLPADDPTLMPMAEDSPLDAQKKNAARLQQESRRAAMISQRAASRGLNIEEYNKLADNATMTAHRATQAQRELLAEQKNVMAQIASTAGSINDEESFRVGYPQLAALEPRMVNQLNLDRDPFTGQPVWGERTKRAMQVVANAGRTAEQMAKERQALETLEEKKRERERKEAEDRRQDRVAEADIAAKQASAETSKARAGLIRRQTDEVGKPRPERAGRAGKADKPAAPGHATKHEKDTAISAIDAEFEGEKFDDSIGAFAADVADRTRKIVADSKNAGEEISKDDARAQAIEELKPFVRDKTVKEPTKVFGITLSAGEKVKTYKRSSTAEKTSDASDDAMKRRVAGAATVGEVRQYQGKQYRFKGGDPLDKKNWEIVGG